jgi:hypothetical protein
MPGWGFLDPQRGDGGFHLIIAALVATSSAAVMFEGVTCT